MTRSSAEPPRHRAAQPVCLFAMLLSLAGCAERAVNRDPPRDWNVLLIVVDSLRADHLGAYGYSRPTSPNLDRLAREGVLFERAITQGAWTRPSIASLLTSLYPHVHGATAMGKALSPDAVTMAELLRSQGMATLAIQTNPTVTSAQNFAQGFERYVERLGASAPRVLSRFSEWLDESRPRRFFAYLHFMDVHLPYDPPEPFRSRFAGAYEGPLDEAEIRSRRDVLGQIHRLTDADRRHVTALYDGCINYFDHSLGVLMEDLRRRRLTDNTIVILVADHGEELFDRGWFEHGHSVHRELVRVPFIIRHPSLPGGVRVPQLVRLIDVLPTVLGFLGDAPPAALMGRDLGPAIADPSSDWEMTGLTESTIYGPEQAAVERGPYKFLYIAPSTHRRDAEFMAVMTKGKTPTPEGTAAFYDVGSDPDERQSNVRHQLAEHWKRMLADERRLAGDRRLDAPNEELDEEQREQLRSLGYLR